jgi:hypothetical protein
MPKAARRGLAWAFAKRVCVPARLKFSSLRGAWRGSSCLNRTADGCMASIPLLRTPFRGTVAAACTCCTPAAACVLHGKSAAACSLSSMRHHLYGALPLPIILPDDGTQPVALLLSVLKGLLQGPHHHCSAMCSSPTTGRATALGKALVLRSQPSWGKRQAGWQPRLPLLGCRAGPSGVLDVWGAEIPGNRHLASGSQRPGPCRALGFVLLQAYSMMQGPGRKAGVPLFTTLDDGRPSQQPGGMDPPSRQPHAVCAAGCTMQGPRFCCAASTG